MEGRGWEEHATPHATHTKFYAHDEHQQVLPSTPRGWHDHALVKDGGNDGDVPPVLLCSTQAAHRQHTGSIVYLSKMQQRAQHNALHGSQVKSSHDHHIPGNRMFSMSLRSSSVQGMNVVHSAGRSSAHSNAQAQAHIKWGNDRAASTTRTLIDPRNAGKQHDRCAAQTGTHWRSAQRCEGQSGSGPTCPRHTVGPACGRRPAP
jgi:hypothetical protein